MASFRLIPLTWRFLHIGSTEAFRDVLRVMPFRAQSSGAAQQPGASPPEDVAGKLKQLAELHASAIVSDEDFEAKRAELLKRF